MTAGRAGGTETSRERRVLRGYRQQGKRFIPPWLQHVSLTETRWMDDILPELIWIALLVQRFGVKEGTAVAVSIAKAAARYHQTAKRAFAATSDYLELDDEEKRCVHSTLKAEGTLERARSGLAALIGHYPDFPLAFLADPSRSNDASCSTLDALREAIGNTSDRQGYAGTFTQATVVYIYFINDKLKVSPGLGLANFPAIEEYPTTEESRRVAASARAAVNFLLTHEIPCKWRNSFWNLGRSLGSCSVD